MANSNGGSFYTLPDGQKLPGTVGADGSFLSADGTTYVTGSGAKAGDGTVIPAGTVEHGVTAPDGTFLPGGVEHHLPDGRTLYGYTAGSDFWSYDGSTAVVGGQVITGTLNFDDGVFTTSDSAYLVSEKGILPGMTAPDGTFLERRIIEGQPVYGTSGSDGSFLSADGTTYVTGSGAKAGDGTVIPAGTVEHGVTAPDGTFLPGGVEYHLPDGRTLYGYTAGSDFWSYDGSTAVVGGQVITGTLNFDDGVFTTSDSAYLVSDKGIIEGVQPPGRDFLPNGELRTIDGKPVYGTVGADGSFLSEDGTTYVTGTGTKAGDGTVIPAGTIQHGVTTPDGYFLPGGSIRTVPGGPTLYGYAKGSGFVSSDGKTVILPSGQVLIGTTNNGIGIFTASDGRTYYVGSGDSIQSANLRLDGSYLLANQQTVMTAESWMVDLMQLDQSIDLVSSKVQPISDEIDAIQQQFSIIKASWSSPAGGTFAEVASKAASVFATLEDVLSDTVDKMRLSYANYENSELQNLKNIADNS